VQRIVQKIKSKKTVIGIIGLGYVGLPIVIRFAEEGFKVLGFDIDLNKVKNINMGKSYIKHIQGNSFKSLVKEKKIQATNDFKKIKKVDAVIICVPTPLNEMREPDLQYIEETGKAVAQNLRKGHILCLESTTYPGTTEEIFLPLFEKSKLKVGRDFFLIYSPEREDPGNAEFTTKTIPKITFFHVASSFILTPPYFPIEIYKLQTRQPFRTKRISKATLQQHDAWERPSQS